MTTIERIMSSDSLDTHNTNSFLDRRGQIVELSPRDEDDVKGIVPRRSPR